VDYLYDGSFEGFLCCIHAHYYKKRAEGIYPENYYQRTMLQPFFIVETEAEKAEKVYKAIQNKMSNASLQRVYRAFLSDDIQKETKLLHYLVLGFRIGKKVDALHSETVVYQVQQLEHKVAAEQHRLLGLVRFSAIDGKKEKDISSDTGRHILYSAIEPDHDILELIADHFAKRLPEETFIMHDTKREKALFCQNGDWYLGYLRKDLSYAVAEDELEYRKLWKKYFNSIAITERTNLDCQKRCMPVRYWKNLTEFHSYP